MTTQLTPPQLTPIGGVDLDPITATWLHGLIATAPEWNLRPLCWHIEHHNEGAVATGYVTVSLLHDAASIRRSWADALGLTAVVDDRGHTVGYSGSAGTLTVALPFEIDPDEHCRICGNAFDPRATGLDGRARYQGGDTCRACAATGGSEDENSS